MLVLGMPTDENIVQKYNESVDALIETYNIHKDGIRKNQTEYNELCAGLMTLEMVILHHFLVTENKEKYRKLIENLQGRLYKGLFKGLDIEMDCGPGYPCGKRCCLGRYKLEMNRKAKQKDDGDVNTQYSGERVGFAAKQSTTP